MPELPELEAFKSYITTHCFNKTIATATSSDKSLIHGISFAQFKKILTGNSLKNPQRYGKYLVISLARSSQKLIMHFGLTGSLFYTKTAQEKVPFSKVIFIFKDHSALHFISVRKFEKIWLVQNIDDIKAIKNLGPDALAISKKVFLDILEKNKSRNIKSILMNQTKIAGIGNEYSDEILFQASTDPHHQVKDLSLLMREKIYTLMKKVLRYAIKVQIKNSKKPSGPDFLSKENRAAFVSSYLQAHRHIDMICPKNKNHKLKKAHIAGRASYYCPMDQK